MFLYNHEQVVSLIEKKLNDEVWTETLVLEEAERFQMPGPADPPVKITTKKPDKRKKHSKHPQTTEPSMYLVSIRVGSMEGILESTIIYISRHIYVYLYGVRTGSAPCPHSVRTVSNCIRWTNSNDYLEQLHHSLNFV